MNIGWYPTKKVEKERFTAVFSLFSVKGIFGHGPLAGQAFPSYAAIFDLKIMKGI